MKNQLDENLFKLRELMLSEIAIQEAIEPFKKQEKEIKTKKEKLLKEILKDLKTDNLSTEFCTIMRNKKLVIEVLDQEKAMSLMKAETNIVIDEDKVEKMFDSLYREDKDELQSVEFEGVRVTEVYKPQVRKKSNGLTE